MNWFCELYCENVFSSILPFRDYSKMEFISVRNNFDRKLRFNNNGWISDLSFEKCQLDIACTSAIKRFCNFTLSKESVNLSASCSDYSHTHTQHTCAKIYFRPFLPTVPHVEKNINMIHLVFVRYNNNNNNKTDGISWKSAAAPAEYLMCPKRRRRSFCSPHSYHQQQQQQKCVNLIPNV